MVGFLGLDLSLTRRAALQRDFLDGFTVSIDPAAGIIRLTPK